MPLAVSSCTKLEHGTLACGTDLAQSNILELDNALEAKSCLLLGAPGWIFEKVFSRRRVIEQSHGITLATKSAITGIARAASEVTKGTMGYS